MEPNKPTKRVYGTDASLSWEEMPDHVRKSTSMALSRLEGLVQTCDPSELGDHVRSLKDIQGLISKATSPEGAGQVTDEELVRRAK